MTDQEKILWKKIAAELELTDKVNVYKMYAQRMGVFLEKGVLHVICPDGHALGVIEKSFRQIIEKTVKRELSAATVVSFTVGKIERELKEKPLGTEVNRTPLFTADAITIESAPAKSTSADSNGTGLAAKYKFENYLMGSNNQLAYAVAKAVAERPGEAYNPLFIHSGVGLGKTHLVQAIGNKILTDRPGVKVIYSTGEAFMNELIEAIQMSKGRGQYTVNKFRNKFRSADVLIIDDVQSIAGRETTQDEFFHTFNTLYMAQKQIVLTSDRPPKDFVNLEDRIRSRFGSGMIVDIQPPDLDMRIAILRNKRDESLDTVPNDVLDVIALAITTNIRELLGAYLQVSTLAKTTGSELTKDFAAKALGQRLADDRKKPLNLHQIVKAVCSYYSVKMDDVKGHRRTKDLVIPRHVAMYLIYDLTKTPYMTIGEYFGGRDHTSILHGIRKVEDELKDVAKTRQDVTNITQTVYAS